MQLTSTRLKLLAVTILGLGALASAPGHAGVLPEDEADVEWNKYSGGGQVIEGKTWLVRKKIGDKIDVEYTHLIDVVSGASIDVQLAASPYIEQRTQDSASVQYLHGKSTYSVSFSHSFEPDYRSNTAVFSISQDMFGDLTTLSMSYRRTWNDVYRQECAMHGKNGACDEKIHDPSFGEKTEDQRSYGVGLTQILTRNSLLSANFEVITDEGWIANPYRDVAYLDQTVGRGFSLEPETDPNTRTSNALGLDYKYYLPYRAAVDVQYRYFQDTWGIRAHTGQLGYTHPWRNWTFDGTFRYYTQTHADFYSNAFLFATQQNFMSRNRELSTYTSWSAGLGVSYQFTIPHFRWITKSTANLRFNHLVLNYKDFTDALLVDPKNGIGIDNAPLYSVSINVIQAFVSASF